jgi:hypothetical protein
MTMIDVGLGDPEQLVGCNAKARDTLECALIVVVAGSPCVSKLTPAGRPMSVNLRMIG